MSPSIAPRRLHVLAGEMKSLRECRDNAALRYELFVSLGQPADFHDTLQAVLGALTADVERTRQLRRERVEAAEAFGQALVVGRRIARQLNALVRSALTIGTAGDPEAKKLLVSWEDAYRILWSYKRERPEGEVTVPSGEETPAQEKVEKAA